MMKLSPRLFIAYHKQISRLEAGEDLRRLRLSCAPNLKQEALDGLQRDLTSTARGDSARIIKGPQDLAAFLSGRR